MKKIYFLMFFLGFIGVLNAQIINFPDANFKAKLLQSNPSNQIAWSSNLGNYISIDSNNDGNIEVSEALQVNFLMVNNSNISDMTGINYFSNIIGLICSGNVLTALDINSLVSLTSLDCSSNQISSLNISSLFQMYSLNCNSNNISSLNISNLNNLTYLYCSANSLTTLDLTSSSSFQKIDCASNQLTSLNLNNSLNLIELYCSANLLTTLDLTSLSSLQKLYCDNNLLSSLIVQGLSNLQILSCNNNQLTSIVLTGLTNLKNLKCNGNLLIVLDISNLNQLQSVECMYNHLTQFISNQNTSLVRLYLYDNNLSTLSVNQLTTLIELALGKNNFVTVNTDGLVDLNIFECYQCEQLSSLNFNDNIHLQNIVLMYTNLSSIELTSQVLIFTQLVFTNNPLLLSINIKNGINSSCLFINDCPNLQYICADDNEVSDIQNIIDNNGNSFCHVNSYCSFVPGGVYYTIDGIDRYDSNANGCDGSDINYPNLKLNFTDGTNSETIIADEFGTYHNEVQAGTYSITPVLENPSYFIVSPTTTSLTFPTTSNPYTQNFCLSANGVYNDLEINLIPTTTARPGFDSGYKMIFKNKGTNSQSGSVNITFNDAVLDFISASPTITNQSLNNINWNFSNLAPFETREIILVFNVNSPSETPPVNSGDVLNFTVNISGSTDESPNDNTFDLNQTVVNSLDPNDKKCLEGITVAQSVIGQYVHYVIHFENNGTSYANNIVVKDVIDLNRFDISTLIPIDGSHPFVTKISQDNKVEFIFENINLPFNDANNDGYVAFKIKTKPTLVVGDTFSNSASIYFDYNFPIATNNFTTTITALTTSEFKFDDYFALSPNPTKNTLNLAFKSDIKMTSLSIYNTLGQLMMTITEPMETIDVSNLKIGNYFIKITSDKGVTTNKFIKE